MSKNITANAVREVFEEHERQGRLDLFAAAALTGLLGGCNSDDIEQFIASWGDDIIEKYTRAAKRFARAMLDNEPKEPS